MTAVKAYYIKLSYKKDKKNKRKNIKNEIIKYKSH